MAVYRAAFAAAVLAVLVGPAGAAANYQPIYSFCRQAGCTDGNEPNGLVEDSAGNLFGTTYKGGTNGFGTIFELKRLADRYKFVPLYSFCAVQNCTDGGYPTGGLIVDTKGNLYGAALIGGSQGNGEVFEMARGAKNDWSLKVLYGFCPEANNCTNGVGPDSGLTYAGEQSGKPYDGKSPLYGTTDGGGIENIWAGIAYEIEPGNNGWNFQVIYSFCAQANCADGAYPFATLVADSSGNLYGTALEGGNATGSGAAFELSPSNGSWNETVLYSFCSLANCTDGAFPHGGLVLDHSGNLDGTTLEGGASCSIDNAGCGTAFALAPSGNAWNETIVHTFCAKADCADGANPEGEPLYAGRAMYATADAGGAARNGQSGGGALYRIVGSKFRLLHKFCAGSGCKSGGNPLTAPLRDPSGHLIGTASTGGRYNGGVVYAYMP